MDALDGVRTIAVLLVILFHVSAPYSAAGYLGVDIFFVLSGYLITTGLLRELETHGRIRVTGFWLRRIKRLLPAVLVMLAVVTVWMFVAAPIHQWRTLSQDLWWTLLYLANWHLMSANSYFADFGTSSPLLHMWSLAVEEQFYLLWPLLLLALLAIVTRVRLRSRPWDRGSSGPGSGDPADWATIPVIAVVTVALIVASALTLAALYDPSSPDRAYMGTDTKAFQPLLGALGAIVLTRPEVAARLRPTHAPLSALGALIMIALFPSLDGPAPHYFTWGATTFAVGALLLVTGLALSNGAGVLARALSVAPVAYLGRISYGLYLWHWPLAVWIIGDREGFRWIRATAVVILTFAAAALSYHLVEMPVRTRSWFTPRRSFSLAAGGIVATLLAVSLGGGTPASATLQRVLPERPLDRDTILLVGDSVPQGLSGDLQEAAEPWGLRITAGTAGGCSPTGIPVPLTPGKPDTECAKVIGFQEQALAQFRPATVLWWSRYELADMRDEEGQVLTPAQEEFWPRAEGHLRSAASRLTSGGARLVFVETDRIGTGVYSRCTPEDCHPFLQRLVEQDEYRQRWNAVLHSYAESDPRARVITVDDLYCTDRANPCLDEVAGEPTRKDGSHFSNEAVVPEVARGIIARVVEAAGLD